MTTRGGAASPNSSGRELGLVVVRGLIALALLFAFLVGIRGLSVAFAGLGQDTAQAIFASVSNPFVALAVGLLATSIVQSSSISTSMIVAFVAVPGAGLPVQSAIAMVMGANIGTTVTNSIVALGYAGRTKEFRQAIAAAACHNLFNLLTALVLFPLELTTGALSAAGGAIANAVGSVGGQVELPNPIGAATHACVAPMERALNDLFGSSGAAYSVLLVLTGALIYGCLTAVLRLLRGPAGADLKRRTMRGLDKHPAANILLGATATAIVQSSSAVTSLLIPLSAAGLLRLRHALALTLGANVGTTLTALIAALAGPALTLNEALQVASAHVVFNLVGVLVFYPHPGMRRLLLALPEKFAALAAVSRKRALIYLLLVYYAVPASVILVFG